MPFTSVLGSSSVIKPGVCTSTTRPTAPYEGQLIYETDTDKVASYNGSAWVYTATAGALVLISATTIGTAVSSVTVSGAFSSTYNNYKITISGGASSGGTSLNLVLGATTTGYYGAQNYTRVDTGVVITDARNNTASWIDAGVGNTNGLVMNIDLFSPNLAKETSYQGWKLVQQTNGSFGYTGGWLNDTTQYTAFTVSPGSGTITGGTIRVYGYANS